MTDFEAFYKHRAGDYDALVACEDHAGNIRPAIARVAPLAGARVVETGAGTGRLTALLAPHVAHVRAFDREPAMLAVARARLDAAGCTNVALAVAPHGALGVPAHEADLALAGWTFGHTVEWHPDDWRDRIDAYVAELCNAVRPGGAVVILETLGTGASTPGAPTAGLAAYYAHLEARHDFARTAIRTDYAFPDLATAERLVRAFFGEELGDRVRREALRVLPEWTGVWHRTMR